MTEEEAQGWRERLEAAVAETVRRRAARASLRRDLDARRQAGLVARHQTKLNRKDTAVPDADKIAVDLTGIGPADRQQLANALTRVASMRHIVPAVAVVLGNLATAVRRTITGEAR